MRVVGAKGGSGVYQTLINLMPRHDVYIEAFLGSGAIMRRKRPARVNIAIDLDHKALEPWEGTDVVRVHSDAIEYLQKWHKYKSSTQKTMIYLDPPYLRSVRKTTRDYYMFELDELRHAQLLDVIRRLSDCYVLISGYDSQLYRDQLSTWSHYSFQTMTRGGPAVEHVWFNYKRPTELHDSRFVGRNFRERERLTRMRRRWANKLLALDPLCRQSILDHLNDIAGPTAGNGDARGKKGRLQ